MGRVREFPNYFTRQFFLGSSWEYVSNQYDEVRLGFAIPIILAIMIFEMRDGKLKKFIQTVSYIPHFFSWIVLGGMMIHGCRPMGFINQVLMSLGMMDKGVNHLLDPNKYWWIAVLSGPLERSRMGNDFISCRNVSYRSNFL